MKPRLSWSWLWVVLGAIYFLLPLYATLDYSFRACGFDELCTTAYQRVLNDPQFLQTFSFSLYMSVLTIVVGVLLLVPTAYWVHLRLRRLRPLVEFVTLLPFVIPAVVLVFGLIRIYSRPPLLLTRTGATSNILLVAGYVVLSLPYMYRAVDAGLRSMDVRTLTEAALSLGAGWGSILFRVILPNLRTALLSGALLTFAIVIGELTLAQYLARPAFGPYLALLGQNRAFEPAALSLLSFALTWIAMGMIAFLTRGRPGQTPVAAGH